jgi:hypothetical protein
MKARVILTIASVLGLVAVVADIALAGLKTTEVLARGGISKMLPTPNSGSEVCIIPDKLASFGNLAYSSKDVDKEAELCALSMHEGVASGVNGLKTTATCPKLNSTNPGVLLVQIPGVGTESEIGWTKSKVESAFCKNKSQMDSKLKGDYEVEAKFKQSITCSYAPSALAAYHLSRMMGGMLNTPVAVVRTMDRETHEGIIQKALKLLSGQSSAIIYKAWSSFQRKSAERTDEKLYIDSGRYLYGALSENISKEFIYTEVSGVGPYDTRYERFQKQGPFQRVASSRSLESLAGGVNFDKVIPIAQQMKDVADMVVLDSLLSQDDRIGNIHFNLYRLKLDGHGNVMRTVLKAKDIKSLEALTPKKSLSRWPESSFSNNVTEDGVLVRIMTLKDNDCGVDVDKRSNNMRVISGVEQLRHLSRTTFHQLLKLHRLAQDSGSALHDFFVNTLLYREKDFAQQSRKGFLANLNTVVSKLKLNCEAGVLKLDLDPTFDARQMLVSEGALGCEENR